MVSTVAKFRTFTAVVPGIYFFLVWKAIANPRLIFFLLFVLLIFAAGTRQFRLPILQEPDHERPTAGNRLGYDWRGRETIRD